MQIQKRRTAAVWTRGAITGLLVAAGSLLIAGCYELPTEAAASSSDYPWAVRRCVDDEASPPELRPCETYDAELRTGRPYVDPTTHHLVVGGPMAPAQWEVGPFNSGVPKLEVIVREAGLLRVHLRGVAYRGDVTGYHTYECELDAQLVDEVTARALAGSFRCTREADFEPLTLEWLYEDRLEISVSGSVHRCDRLPYDPLDGYVPRDPCRTVSDVAARLHFAAHPDYDVGGCEGSCGPYPGLGG